MADAGRKLKDAILEAGRSLGNITYTKQLYGGHSGAHVALVTIAGENNAVDPKLGVFVAKATAQGRSSEFENTNLVRSLLADNKSQFLSRVPEAKAEYRIQQDAARSTVAFFRLAGNAGFATAIPTKFGIREDLSRRLCPILEEITEELLKAQKLTLRDATAQEVVAEWVEKPIPDHSDARVNEVFTTERVLKDQGVLLARPDVALNKVLLETNRAQWIMGLGHGDVHLGNIILSRDADQSDAFFLIDWAHFKNECPVGYDLAFLEVSALVEFIANDTADLVSIARMGGQATDGQATDGKASVVGRLIDQVRKAIFKVDFYESHKTVLERHLLLARVVAGLQWASFQLDRKQRVAAVCYAGGAAAALLRNHYDHIWRSIGGYEVASQGSIGKRLKSIEADEYLPAGGCAAQPQSAETWRRIESLVPEVNVAGEPYRIGIHGPSAHVNREFAQHICNHFPRKFMDRCQLIDCSGLNQDQLADKLASACPNDTEDASIPEMLSNWHEGDPHVVVFHEVSGFEVLRDLLPTTGPALMVITVTDTGMASNGRDVLLRWEVNAKCIVECKGDAPAASAAGELAKLGPQMQQMIGAIAAGPRGGVHPSLLCESLRVNRVLVNTLLQRATRRNLLSLSNENGRYRLQPAISASLSGQLMVAEQGEFRRSRARWYGQMLEKAEERQKLLESDSGEVLAAVQAKGEAADNSSGFWEGVASYYERFSWLVPYDGIQAWVERIEAREDIRARLQILKLMAELARGLQKESKEIASACAALFDQGLHMRAVQCCLEFARRFGLLGSWNAAVAILGGGLDKMAGGEHESLKLRLQVALGNALLRTGNPEAGISKIEKLRDEVARGSNGKQMPRDDAAALARLHAGLGRFFQRVGRHEEAVAELEGAIELDKGLEDRRHLSIDCVSLGSGLLKHGDLKGAEQPLLEGLEIAEQMADRQQLGVASLLRGAWLQASKRLEDAIQPLKRAMDCGDATQNAKLIVSSRQRLISVLRDLGQHGQAEELKLDLARHLKRSGKTMDAIRELVRAHGNSDSDLLAKELSDLLGDTVGVGGSDVGLFLRAGSVLEAANFYKEAVAVYERVKVRVKKIGDSGTLALVLNCIGSVESKQGYYVKALSTLREGLVVVDGKNVDGECYLRQTIADVLVRFGKLEDALKELQRIEELPGSIGRVSSKAIALGIKGRILKEQQDKDGALACYTAALELEEQGGSGFGLASARTSLANHVCSRDDAAPDLVERAKDCADKALEWEYSHGTARGRCIVLFVRGRLLSRSKSQLALALEDLCEAERWARSIKDLVTLQRILKSKGAALRASGERAEALSVLEDCVELAKSEGDVQQEALALRELSRCAGSANEKLQVQSRFEELLEAALGEDRYHVLLSYAMVLRESGKPKRAWDILREAMAVQGRGSRVEAAVRLVKLVWADSERIRGATDESLEEIDKSLVDAEAVLAKTPRAIADPVWMVREKALWLAGQHERALDFLRNARSCAGSPGEAKLQLATRLVELNRRDEAKGIIKDLIGSNADAMVKGRARWLSARMFREEGQFPRCADELGKAMELLKHDAPEELVDEHTKELVRAKDVTALSDAVEKLAPARGELASEVYVRRALELARVLEPEQRPKANSLYEQLASAVEGKGFDGHRVAAVVHERRGLALMHQGMFKQAEGCLNMAMDRLRALVGGRGMHPEEPRMHRRMAEILIRWDQKDASLVEKGIELCRESARLARCMNRFRDVYEAKILLAETFANRLSQRVRAGKEAEEALEAARLASPIFVDGMFRASKIMADALSFGGQKRGALNLFEDLENEDLQGAQFADWQLGELYERMAGLALDIQEVGTAEMYALKCVRISQGQRRVAGLNLLGRAQRVGFKYLEAVSSFKGGRDLCLAAGGVDEMDARTKRTLFHIYVNLAAAHKDIGDIGAANQALDAARGVEKTCERIASRDIRPFGMNTRAACRALSNMCDGARELLQRVIKESGESENDYGKLYAESRLGELDRYCKRLATAEVCLRGVLRKIDGMRVSATLDGGKNTAQLEVSTVVRLARTLADQRKWGKRVKLRIRGCGSGV